MAYSDQTNELTGGGSHGVLVERARNGNREAFSELAEVQYARLLRIACRFVGNPDEAQDVVQDALCNAFLHMGEYRDEAPFPAWLVRITRNQALTVLRRRKADRTVLLEDLAPSTRNVRPTEWARTYETPEALCFSAEVEQILKRCIARLDPPYGTVLALRELDELSHAEIARQLTLTVGAVKLRIHRARLTLRRGLRICLEQLRSLLPASRGSSGH